MRTKGNRFKKENLMERANMANNIMECGPMIQ
jgi:hypothetical protein